MRYHFSGVAGAGMNPLASLVRARGHDVQGSDRSFDQGKNREIAARLQGLGIQLAPHDGAAVTRAIDRFVYSAAVEADTPEMRAARALGLHCVSRPQLLAEVVNAGGPGIAVSGTSGKSTILGMVAWLLREGGVPATVLGGAALVGEGTGGCFIAGPAEGPVVAEACESDGTLAGYRPAIGLVHNVSRDHAELPALRPQFAAFAPWTTTRTMARSSARPSPRRRPARRPSLSSFSPTGSARPAFCVPTSRTYSRGSCGLKTASATRRSSTRAALWRRTSRATSWRVTCPNACTADTPATTTPFASGC